jgi:hypothetical protein
VTRIVIPVAIYDRHKPVDLLATSSFNLNSRSIRDVVPIVTTAALFMVPAAVDLHVGVQDAIEARKEFRRPC